MQKALVEKHSSIRAYDSNSCFGAKLPSLTLVNFLNSKKNISPRWVGHKKGHAMLDDDLGNPYVEKKQIPTMDNRHIKFSRFG